MGDLKQLIDHKKRVVMKCTVLNVLLIFCLFIIPSEVAAQTDKEEIIAIRNASNQALKTYDYPKAFSYLTEDVFITTGNGSLISGRNALMGYIQENNKGKLYWIRDADRIVVNEESGLAWENGIWNGYDPTNEGVPVFSGNYAAMWTKASGKWQIKSQLFVTLNN